MQHHTVSRAAAVLASALLLAGCTQAADPLEQAARDALANRGSLCDDAVIVSEYLVQDIEIKEVREDAPDNEMLYDVSGVSEGTGPVYGTATVDTELGCVNWVAVVPGEYPETD